MNEILRRRRALMGAKAGSGFAHGSWEDLFWHIDKGDYATEYSVGEEIATVLKNDASFPFQIVAFDTDTISGSTDKAPVTLISTRLYNKRRYNPAYEDGVSGTGNIGGWAASEVRAYLNNTEITNLPDNIVARILQVEKYTKSYDDAETLTKNMLSNDQLWIPSYREMFGSAVNESAGPVYTGWFTSNGRRKKKAGTTDTGYWIRTAYNKSSTYTIASTGAANNAATTSSNYGLAMGFCVGGVQG